MQIIQAALIGMNVSALMYSNVSILWAKLNTISFIVGFFVICFCKIFLLDRKKAYLEDWINSKGENIKLQSYTYQFLVFISALFIVFSNVSSLVYSIYWIMNI